MSIANTVLALVPGFRRGRVFRIQTYRCDMLPELLTLLRERRDGHVDLLERLRVDGRLELVADRTLNWPVAEPSLRRSLRSFLRQVLSVIRETI